MPIDMSCPECDATFPVQAAAIGMKVRCTKCRTIFRAIVPGEEFDDRRVRRRRRRDDEEDDAPRVRRRSTSRGRRPAKKSNLGVTLVTLGIGTIAIGLGLAFFLGAFDSKGKSKAAEEDEAKLNKPIRERPKGDEGIDYQFNLREGPVSQEAARKDDFAVIYKWLGGRKPVGEYLGVALIAGVQYVEFPFEVIEGSEGHFTHSMLSNRTHSLGFEFWIAKRKGSDGTLERVSNKIRVRILR